jgi:hypothetical protein
MVCHRPLNALLSHARDRSPPRRSACGGATSQPRPADEITNPPQSRATDGPPPPAGAAPAAKSRQGTQQWRLRLLASPIVMMLCARALRTHFIDPELIQ